MGRGLSYGAARCSPGLQPPAADNPPAACSAVRHPPRFIAFAPSPIPPLPLPALWWRPASMARGWRTRTCACVSSRWSAAMRACKQMEMGAQGGRLKGGCRVGQRAPAEPAGPLHPARRHNRTAGRGDRTCAAASWPALLPSCGGQMAGGVGVGGGSGAGGQLAGAQARPHLQHKASAAGHCDAVPLPGVQQPCCPPAPLPFSPHLGSTRQQHRLVLLELMPLAQQRRLARRTLGLQAVGQRTAGLGPSRKGPSSAAGCQVGRQGSAGRGKAAGRACLPS